MNDPLAQTSHRPWPLPDRPWLLRMRWHELLFAHWPLPPEVLRPLVPAALELDTYEGEAWIGVTPFRMSGVRPRFVPEALGLAFPELNVRTYVRSPGRFGVWFFSLDAASRLGVRLARKLFGLPYYDAEMHAAAEGERVVYWSRRVHRGASPAELRADYGPVGELDHPAPGTLDYWLTERYCLYAVDTLGELRVGDIHHAPWLLQPAAAEFGVNTMVEPLGIQLPEEPPLLHFARELDVVAWTAQPLAKATPPP